MDALSKSDRGRSAERIPTGSAISSQTITPPKTSEAVTGAALRISVETGVARTNDRPRSPWGRTKTGTPATWTGTGLINRHMNLPYWT